VEKRAGSHPGIAFHADSTTTSRWSRRRSADGQVLYREQRGGLSPAVEAAGRPYRMQRHANPDRDGNCEGTAPSDAPQRLSAETVAQLLRAVRPRTRCCTPCHMVSELIAEIRRLDRRITATATAVTTAVQAIGSALAPALRERET
jgi:hypothetical protein